MGDGVLKAGDSVCTQVAKYGSAPSSITTTKESMDMPRRNNNALRNRTRQRSATSTPQMAIRRSDDTVILVTPITKPNAAGLVTVDMGGLLAEVKAQSLIRV